MPLLRPSRRRRGGDAAEFAPQRRGEKPRNIRVEHQPGLLRRQRAVDERDGHHVLNAVIAIGGIIQRSRLVDDPHRRLLRLDHDTFDLLQPILHLRVQLMRDVSISSSQSFSTPR